MPVIVRFACQVTERIQPDKVILFGSHAYGVPHEGIDVDLFLVMLARDQHSQALKLRCAVPAGSRWT
jgi:hypothetical protein